MTVEDNERIVNKIVGLWAKAMSTNSDAERDAFIDGARRLMDKYAIDESVLDRDNPDRDTPITLPWVYSKTSRHHEARRVILSVACEIVGSGTRVGWYDTPDNDDHHWCLFLGFTANIEAAKVIYTNLVNQALREAWNRGVVGEQPVLDFFTGFGFAATERVRDARARDAAHEPGAALVLADRDDEVRALLDQIDHDEPEEFEIDDDSYATNAGYTAGNRADLGIHPAIDHRSNP